MGETPDLSSLFEMLNEKGIDVNNIMQTFSSNTNNSSSKEDSINNSNVSSNSNQQSINNSQMPDMETMMKVMKIMKSMNSNVSNPSANLLYSLKPFLRESKKEKIDQYVNFLKISSIISEINKSGGDLK